jgi:ABC-type antimicrobial peptide transport system ATPase subunit
MSIKLEKCGKKKVYGFTVDTPSHWFITSNYVITKNSGKSTLGLQLCKYVDPTFNLSRVVFTPEEFREVVYKAKSNQAIMFDEAFTGFSSRASLSGVNKTLISLMMQIRQMNFFQQSFY